MAIGVPETEVYQAADRVLARGERPTVERVRAEIGRGSPARVGQLLERWWDALAKRLAGETRLPELPAEVATAFTTAWATATEHASLLAQRHLAQIQTALAQEKEALAAERLHWSQEVDIAHAATAVAVDARAIAERRLTDHQQIIDMLRREAHELVHQRDSAVERRAALEKDLARLQTKLDQQEMALTKEREAATTHIRGVEDRAHAEVDRAREELKAARAHLTQHEREMRSLQQTLANERRQHAEVLRRAERDVASQTARAQTLEEQLRQSPAGSSKGRRPRQLGSRSRAPRGKSVT